MNRMTPLECICIRKMDSKPKAIRLKMSEIGCIFLDILEDFTTTTTNLKL